MARKTIVSVFPRNKYPATASGRVLLPKDREKLKALFGSADEVWLHTRIYARDTNVSLDFDVTHGGLGDENPSEGIRSFSLTKANQEPASTPPYTAGTMGTLPDDGVFSFAPGLGLVDVQGKAYNANGTIEFETWATLVFRQ